MKACITFRMTNWISFCASVAKSLALRVKLPLCPLFKTPPFPDRRHLEICRGEPWLALARPRLCITFRMINLDILLCLSGKSPLALRVIIASVPSFYETLRFPDRRHLEICRGEPWLALARPRLCITFRMTNLDILLCLSGKSPLALRVINASVPSFMKLLRPRSPSPRNL